MKTIDTTKAPEFFESAFAEPEKYWAYVYPDGLCLCVSCSSFGLHEMHRVFSKNPSDVVAALTCDGTWEGHSPMYSGELREVEISVKGVPAVIFNGYPNIERIIPAE